MTNLVRRNHDSRGSATKGNQRDLGRVRMMDALLGWDPLHDGTRITTRARSRRPFDVEELKDAYLLKAD
jgi:hypothetical protein